jgi:hypothetical protein
MISFVCSPDVIPQGLDSEAHKAVEVPAFAIERVEEGFQGQSMELVVTCRELVCCDYSRMISCPYS